MADYGAANVKVVIQDISSDADSVSGSLANDIRTFVRTLDDNTILSTDSVKLDATRIAWIILYL
tara:strand:+ start:10927 stop:11118 length:192 start_codon:yes stop_codon:yes gene_type:complete